MNFNFIKLKIFVQYQLFLTPFCFPSEICNGLCLVFNTKDFDSHAACSHLSFVILSCIDTTVPQYLFLFLFYCTLHSLYIYIFVGPLPSFIDNSYIKLFFIYFFNFQLLCKNYTSYICIRHLSHILWIQINSIQIIIYFLLHIYF